jgi:hypothetical protein
MAGRVEVMTTGEVCAAGVNDVGLVEIAGPWIVAVGRVEVVFGVCVGGGVNGDSAERPPAGARRLFRVLLRVFAQG